MNNSLVRLTEVLSAICPIDGVSGTKNTRIDYKAEATPEQREAASAALAAFDWSDEAHVVWEKAKRREAAVALLNSSDPSMVAIRGFATLVIRRLRPLLQAAGVPAMTNEELIQSWASVIADGDVDNNISQ